MVDSLLLIPAPRELTLTGGEYRLSAGQLILLEYPNPQALLDTARRFQRSLREACEVHWEIAAGPAVPDGLAGLKIQVDPERPACGGLYAQGYTLAITPSGILITAASPAGAFYGICTLCQIVERCAPSLPCLQIRDRPDFPVRGVMLDVSRDRVPTMETLYALVDRLAGWKINQLQLYFEHAFAYRNHPRIWEHTSPLTGEEILELDRFCKERFIELVPNQQSCGHLSPWLNHPDYKHLAEVEDGFETPWGRRPGSYSLAFTRPDSIAFLRGLYAELLPHFTSRMVNVGCDEPWDLGQGQSKADCAARGSGRVYLEFLLKVYAEIKRLGRTPQFWGDIIVDYPELIPELPKDLILLEWGYEADHPFSQHLALFAASGIPFYVCPGTSSWCSIAGRSDNALTNLVHAAEQGLSYGAIGYLNTDWGDYGHWQAWPVSYLGLLAGAAYGWSLESSRRVDLPLALSWHCFGDKSGGMGRLAYEMGNLYQALGPRLHNSSLLFWMLQWPLEKIRVQPGLSPEALEAVLVRIEELENSLEAARIDGPDAGLVREEFRLTLKMLRHACRRGLLALADDPAQAEGLREALQQDLDQLVERYGRIWLQRNRPGGLRESKGRLETLAADYRRANEKAN